MLLLTVCYWLLHRINRPESLLSHRHRGPNTTGLSGRPTQLAFKAHRQYKRQRINELDIKRRSFLACQCGQLRCNRALPHSLFCSKRLTLLVIVKDQRLAQLGSGILETWQFLCDSCRSTVGTVDLWLSTAVFCNGGSLFEERSCMNNSDGWLKWYRVGKLGTVLEV